MCPLNAEAYPDSLALASGANNNLYNIFEFNSTCIAIITSVLVQSEKYLFDISIRTFRFIRNHWHDRRDSEVAYPDHSPW